MSQRWKTGRAAREWAARSLRVVSARRSGQDRFEGAPRSIAIPVPRGLGDAILLTPLLRLLRQRFPAAEIHLLVFSAALQAFFRGDPNVTAVHYPGDGRLRYAARLLRRRFDVLYNPKDHPSRIFLLHGAVLRVGFRIGHDVPLHRGLFDYLLEIDYHSNMALKNCAAMRAFGTSAEPADCRPYVPPMRVSPAVAAWVSAALPGGLIGLNISAGKPDRRWTDTCWSALVRRFPECRFTIFSSPGDLPRRHAIEAQAPNVVASPPTGNLYEVSLMVARLRLLVSPDTSLVHVASATGTPVVGLYTNARHSQTRFGPFLVPHDIVASPSAFVRDIPVDDIEAAVRRMLAP